MDFFKVRCFHIIYKAQWRDSPKINKKTLNLKSIWKRESNVRCQLMTYSLASCLASEPLKLFLSCDKFKRDTKQEGVLWFCEFAEGF